MRAWLLLILLAACGQAHVAAPGPGLRVAPPRADGRLPLSAIPRSYAIELDVDPKQHRFSGKETIEIDLPAPTATVVLHARQLHIERATITVGTEIFDATIYARAEDQPDDDERLLGVSRLLPAGPATLHLEWSAAFNRRRRGVFTETIHGRSYAFTQFESTDARSAFPCFDEPTFKTPFDLSVRVPRGLTAIANTRELSRDGSLFRFAKTAPLPTYLVAFVVGQFDIRDIPRATPPAVRVVTTKGQGAKADLTLEATSHFVDAFTNWLGVPYPFDKLDVVAVPRTSELGMENAGLITVLERALLRDPDKVTLDWQKDLTRTIAHEVAHQWAGDLVTADWWNEIWLNEGMATWLDGRATAQWKPEWNIGVDVALGRLRVMNEDGLAATRAVRRPRTSTNEIASSFDDITYRKGAAVLETIQQWIGEDAMRRGIRTYLQENAGRTATSERLFSALDRASGKDVTQMAHAYLDSPGVPLVSVATTCNADGWSIDLAQSRWKPLGSPLVDEATWTIPVSVRTDTTTKCFDLDRAKATFAGGAGCPKWVFPSTGAYYRFSISEEETLRLAATKELGPTEQVTLLEETWAAVRAGRLPAAVLPKLFAATTDVERIQHLRDELTWYFPKQSPPVVEEKAALAALERLYGPDRDHVDVEETLRHGFEHPFSRRVTQAFVRAHWDDLLSRLSPRDSLILLFGASNACTHDELEDRRAFYEAKAATMPGSRAVLDAQLEWASFCTALREANPDFVIAD